MPKISIAAATPTNNLEATKFLHSSLGWALSSASKMLQMGGAGVFYTCQLYMNDHVEHDRNIRSILDFFESKNIALRIVDIEDDEHWADLMSSLTMH